MSKRVSAMIVSFNPPESILECITSLVDQDVEAEIIVVDNASTNRLPERIAEQFPQVKLVYSSSNVGFGAATNIAFQYADGDYLLAINPDVVLKQGTLGAMIAYLESHPEVGIVGPLLCDGNAQIIPTARAQYTWWRVWAKYWGLDRIWARFVYGSFLERMKLNYQPFPVDWLQGSCLLVRRQAYQSVQGFDEAFFLFMEDMDFCERVRQAQWNVMYIPYVSAVHYGGTTTARYPYIRVSNYHKSPLRYFRKQDRSGVVLWLKLVFALELLAKVTLRGTLNLLNHRRARAENIRAEWQVLKELWWY